MPKALGAPNTTGELWRGKLELLFPFFFVFFLSFLVLFLFFFFNPAYGASVLTSAAGQTPPNIGTPKIWWEGPISWITLKDMESVVLIEMVFSHFNDVICLFYDIIG